MNFYQSPNEEFVGEKREKMDLWEELTEESNPSFENIENASHMDITQEPEKKMM